MDYPVAIDDYYPLGPNHSVAVDEAIGLPSNDVVLYPITSTFNLLTGQRTSNLKVQLVDPPPAAAGNLALNGHDPATNIFDGTFSYVLNDLSQEVVTFSYRLLYYGTQGVKIGNTAFVRLFKQLQERISTDVQLKSATFHQDAGIGIRHIYPDPPPAPPPPQRPPPLLPYSDKQWNDPNHLGIANYLQGGSKPVALVRNETMMVTAQFDVAPWLVPVLKAYLTDRPANHRLTLIGSGPQQQTFTAKFSEAATTNTLVLDPGTNTLTVVRAISDIPFARNSAWAGLHILNWNLRLIGTHPLSTPVDVGGSINDLYVLWDRPPANLPLFHMLVDVSTRGASGIEDVADIPRSIFDGKLKLPANGPGVTRVDGAPLHYYNDGNGKWTTTNATTFKLLRDKDGMCGAWGAFFLDLLRVQGLSYETPWVKITAKNPREWFLVKDWTFKTKLPMPVSPPRAGGVLYDYKNVLVQGDSQGGEFPLRESRKAGKYLSSPNFPPGVDGNKDANGNPRTGLKGQNSATPVSTFPNHILIAIGKFWYDPSYGVSYGPAGNNTWTNQQYLDDIEAKVIAGYAFEYVNPDTGDILYIRQGSGNAGLTGAPAAQPG